MKASRNRNEKDKAKVREAMLKAAGELLLEGGYDKLTLAKVAKKVGFATTNVYRYFDSKDDLIYEAIKASFVDFGKRMELAYHEGETGLERVTSIGYAYLSFAKANPVPYHLMFVQKSDYLFVERQVPGVDKIAYLVQALGDGMHDGSIRHGNLPAMANMLWMTMHGIVTLADTMVFISDTDREAATDEAFKTLLKGLEP